MGAEYRHGFLNNAAHRPYLVLVGSNNASTFLFSGPGATNAIYIDLIELQGGATNRASKFINGQIVQTYTAVDANPGMTVYTLQTRLRAARTFLKN